MRILFAGVVTLASLHCVIARADVAATAATAPAGMDVLDFGETPEQAARRMGLPATPLVKKKGPAAPERSGYTPEDVLNSRGMAPPVVIAAPDLREDKEDRLGNDEHHGHHGRDHGGH